MSVTFRIVRSGGNGTRPANGAAETAMDELGQAWLASLRDGLAFTRQRLLVAVGVLDADDLDARPVPTIWTPREQLLHVADAEAIWRSRAGGESLAGARWRLGDEARTAAPDRSAVEAVLAAERARTVAWLDALSADDLPRPVDDGHGRTLSVVWVLQHLMRHDAHHAGQILALWRTRHPDRPVGSGYARIEEGLRGAQS